jgi:GTP-binding protein EngB required for normal cell division
MNKYANIMLLGRTGVGKSSFINYLIGKDVCKAATGMPVTQGFATYTYNTGKIPLRIYDSKGLEVENYSNQKEEIIKFIKTKCNDADVFNWLHTIFYCINLGGRRLDPGEIEFIKSIKGNIAQNVHIIITHCKENQSASKGTPEHAMEEYLRSNFGKEIKIYFVNSVSVKFRNGTVVNQFGRKKVLDEIFKLLWRDISLKISNDYSAELHSGYVKISYRIKNALEATVGQINTMKVFQEISGSRDVCSEWEDIFEDKEQELDSLIDNLNENYQNRIKPLADFYNSYSECMGCYIQAYDISDFGTSELFEIDIDRILNQSKLGKFVEEIDNISDDDIFGIIGGVIKGGYYLVTIRKRFQEIIDDISWELQKSIPSEEQIQKVVYEKLIEQMR